MSDGPVFDPDTNTHLNQPPDWAMKQAVDEFCDDDRDPTGNRSRA